MKTITYILKIEAGSDIVSIMVDSQWKLSLTC